MAVIQPARIQDIEKYAQIILPQSDIVDTINDGLFRAAHDQAKSLNLVTPVRRGTYFLTQAGRELVRRDNLHKEIDNIRFFLMKAQRKRYK